MKIAIAASVFVLSCGSTFGADLLRQTPKIIAGPTPLSSTPVSEWSGFYVGANAGAASATVSATALGEVSNQSFTTSQSKLDRSGPLGGLQAGFALQSGSIVYGLETDIGFGAIRGSLDVTSSDGATKTHLQSKLSMLSTLRGRVGYAFDNVLLYGTGGFATAYHEAKANAVTSAGANSAGALTEWVPGWTLGLGGEYALTSNVSMKLEYLYAQLNNKVLGQSVTHSLNLVRAGVNYRF
jgi:outer membrane immunogenic protein